MDYTPFQPFRETFCTICFKIKPQITQFFHIRKSGKNAGNFRKDCIECGKERCNGYYHNPRPQIERYKTNLDGQKLKRCSVDGLFYIMDSENFGPDKRSSDGFNCCCRACALKIKNTYAQENRGKIRESQKKYRKNNKNNPKFIAYLKKKNKRKNEKLSKNPKYRLERKMSRQLCKALKGKKGGKSWTTFVDYTKGQFFSYIKNHPNGLYDEELLLQGELHIDHIIPRAMFDYESSEDQEFKDCWALINLQPLPEKIHTEKTIIDQRLIEDHKLCKDLLSWTDPASEYYKDFVRK